MDLLSTVTYDQWIYYQQLPMTNVFTINSYLLPMATVTYDQWIYGDDQELSLHHDQFQPQ